MSINDLVLKVNDVLTGSVLIIALVGIGLLFTFKLGFIQIRGFKDGWNRTFGGLFSKKGDAGKDGMSSFQALATAIAAQVGTGNIAGAATAIAVGGPGAIFWMWISAFLGMSTIFAEAVMAQPTLDFMKWVVTSDEGTTMLAEQFGPCPFKNAKTPANVFFADANAYTAAGKYIVTWAFNWTPAVDDWRAGVVDALTQYTVNGGSWDNVKTAFVDGWATQYAKENG